MMKYRIGDVYHTTMPQPLQVQYSKKFKPKEWNNLPLYFSAQDVWCMNGIFYYSYYDATDNDIYQYKLDGDTWVPVTWSGFDKFDGSNVWVAFGKYYVSEYYDGEYHHYRIEGTRLVEIPLNLNFRGRTVWRPYNDESAYVVVDGITYKFTVQETFGRAILYQGLPYAGGDTWSDGEHLYGSMNLIYDEEQLKFVEHSFTGNAVPQVTSWLYTDGTKVFSFNNAVLVGNSFLSYELSAPKDFTESIFPATSFWTDGTNIYITARYVIKGTSITVNYSYVWEPASTADFEHDLPSTANTVTINLYMNNSEKNVIGKSLTSVRNLNGTFKQEADITNLSIQVDLSSVPNFNYIRVPLFNRYYFVDNIINIRDDLWEISCHVDVLESFKDTIMSTYGLIERNEFEFNPKIIDHLRVIEQGVTTEVLTSGMTLETVLNAGVPETMTETTARFMLVGTFMSLEGEIL